MANFELLRQEAQLKPGVDLLIFPLREAQYPAEQQIPEAHSHASGCRAPRTRGLLLVVARTCRCEGGRVSRRRRRQRISQRLTHLCPLCSSAFPGCAWLGWFLGAAPQISSAERVESASCRTRTAERPPRADSALAAEIGNGQRRRDQEGAGDSWASISAFR